MLDWYRNAGRLRSKLFSLGIGPSFGGFGDRAVIEPPLRVYGERRIIIGAAVHIGASSWLQVLGGEGPSAIEIGDGSSLGARCTISAVEHVSIGRSVLLASNVYVSDHSHDVADPSRPISRQGVTDVRPVAIGDGAWLGQNTVVTPGVRIGRGAVVGANSVVTRDVPDRCVAVGAPARVVRQLLEGEGW
ncbi:MAG: acyltransferase [Acidimicrobiales bacterium]